MLAADTPSAIVAHNAGACRRRCAVSPMLSPFNRARLSLATAPSGQDRLIAHDREDDDLAKALTGTQAAEQRIDARRACESVGEQSSLRGAAAIWQGLHHRAEVIERGTAFAAKSVSAMLAS